jgi:hypothetical protein
MLEESANANISENGTLHQRGRSGKAINNRERDNEELTTVWDPTSNSDQLPFN